MVQFGAVYLMQDSYPCPIALSRQLNYTDDEDVVEIEGWVHAYTHFSIAAIDALRKDCPDHELPPPPPRELSSFHNYGCEMLPTPEEPYTLETGHIAQSRRLCQLPYVQQSNTAVVLDSSYQLKPVAVQWVVCYARSIATNVMRQFHLMSLSPAAAQYVRFPTGMMGYPCPVAQPNLVLFVKKLAELDKMKRGGVYKGKEYEMHSV